MLKSGRTSRAIHKTLEACRVKSWRPIEKNPINKSDPGNFPIISMVYGLVAILKPRFWEPLDKPTLKLTLLLYIDNEIMRFYYN